MNKVNVAQAANTKIFIILYLRITLTDCNLCSIIKNNSENCKTVPSAKEVIMGIHEELIQLKLSFSAKYYEGNDFATNFEIKQIIENKTYFETTIHNLVK